MADSNRLIGTGMPFPQAKEVASQIETGGLQIGTTATTAMAGNRVPTATIRGGVLLQSGSAIATVEDLVTALIAAGVLSA